MPKKIAKASVTNLEDTVSRTDKPVKTRKAKPKAEENVEKKYLYKVVRVNGEGLLHSASVPQGSRLHKIYAEGKVTKAHPLLYRAGYGLACFETVEQALNFRRCSGGFQLWKVEVDEFKAPADQRPSIEDLAKIAPQTRARDNYNKVLTNIKKNLVRDNWPSGCVVASSVILIERIK